MSAGDAPWAARPLFDAVGHQEAQRAM
jgi:hypothetical protein